MEIKRVFLDTSFLIRLLNDEDEDHVHARSYFNRFKKDKVEFLISTIAMAEYGIKDNIEHLPLRNARIIPFNANHAQQTAAFARAAFAAKRKGVVALEKRVVIPNDTKLMAQAEVEKVDLFIARDDNCIALHKFLKAKGLVHFQFLGLRTTPEVFFGELLAE